MPLGSPKMTEWDKVYKKNEIREVFVDYIVLLRELFENKGLLNIVTS